MVARAEVLGEALDPDGAGEAGADVAEADAVECGTVATRVATRTPTPSRPATPAATGRTGSRLGDERRGRPAPHGDPVAFTRGAFVEAGPSVVVPDGAAAVRLWLSSRPAATY
ncbi:MAG TPA: hypothetical protein VHN80_04160 [Kineosporiaceae bacterium]|nr:hypothetical protein [Kineosporiaceae bacterium]